MRINEPGWLPSTLTFIHLYSLSFLSASVFIVTNSYNKSGISSSFLSCFNDSFIFWFAPSMSYLELKQNADWSKYPHVIQIKVSLYARVPVITNWNVTNTLKAIHILAHLVINNKSICKGPHFVNVFIVNADALAMGCYFTA